MVFMMTENNNFNNDNGNDNHYDIYNDKGDETHDYKQQQFLLKHIYCTPLQVRSVASSIQIKS